MTRGLSRKMFIVSWIIIVGLVSFTSLLMLRVAGMIWALHHYSPTRFAVLSVLFISLLIAALVETRLSYFLIKKKAFKIGYKTSNFVRENPTGHKTLILTYNMFLAGVALAALFHKSTAMATMGFTLFAGILACLIWKSIRTIKRKHLSKMNNRRTLKERSYEAKKEA